MKTLALVFALLLVTAACEDDSRAVDPIWGKQACAHCAMLVSDPHFAAELTTTAGDRFFFDDPGCMAAYVHDRAPQVRKMWVRDQAGVWVDAANAHFEKGASSPMDYGFMTNAAGHEDWAAVVRTATERTKRGGP
ncbi:MAG: hypothetical protein ABI551_02545 [Polyangiaceae bacterium]